MSEQRYRADRAEHQLDGATVWRTDWMGGPTLARIDRCRLAGLLGEPRRTVYIMGEPDTWYSVPAVARYMGVRISGYVTVEEDESGHGNLVFQHCYY